MKCLIIGGTGKVGARLTKRLLERGVDVAVLCRTAERIHSVPAPATTVVADMVADPKGAADAFRGRDVVFMLNKGTLQETVEGILAVTLARDAGVPRFVYQSVHLVEELAHLPHVASKLAIKHAVKTSGMDYTFIAPNHFFQNDETVRGPLLEKGLYLTPLGSVGCWSVDSGDIAEAAAIVLTTEGHSGQSYNLVGPSNLTGKEAAAAWARALGKEVRYVERLEEWQNHVRPFLPPWLHYDLSLMYRHFASHGMLGTLQDVERVTALLGRPPRSFQDYASEQAKAWVG